MFSYSHLSSFTLFRTLNIQLAVVGFFFFFFSFFFARPVCPGNTLDDQGFEARKGQDIFHIVQVPYGAHLTSYSMRKVDYLPGGKAFGA
jgi:hypothetical protein